MAVSMKQKVRFGLLGPVIKGANSAGLGRHQ